MQKDYQILFEITFLQQTVFRFFTKMINLGTCKRVSNLGPFSLYDNHCSQLQPESSTLEFLMENFSK